MLRQAKAIAGLLLGLAVIVAVAGCSGAGSGAATPTATTVLNATYTSTDGVYSIGYPSTWTTSPLTIANTSGAAVIGSDDQTDVVIIEPFTLKSSAPYPRVLEGGINTSPFTNSKVDSAVTTQTYPSGIWTVANGTTEHNGTPYTARLYGTLHGDHTFVILVFAPTSSAATDQTTYFDPMLSSLTFIN